MTVVLFVSLSYPPSLSLCLSLPLLSFPCAPPFSGGSVPEGQTVRLTLMFLSQKKKKQFSYLLNRKVHSLHERRSAWG